MTRRWPPKFHTVVGLGVLVVLSACTPENDQQVQGASVPGQEQSTSVPGPEPMHRVVFGPGDFERAGGASTLPFVPASYWRPSPTDVGQFETALDSALRAAPTEQAYNPPRDLASYTVQYVGYVLDGRRYVYANGACSDAEDADTRWIFVFDGGACYFGASFDVEAGRLSNLNFNGEA